MLKKYAYIDVVDTAILCGLDIKQSTLNNDEVQARCPYCNDWKYRMYLSRDPENATWWCHNCGTGGNAVILYADFNPYHIQMTTKDAFEALMNEPRIQTGYSPYRDEQAIIQRIKPLHERSRIYLAMLNLMVLENGHRQNLRDRGLSDKIINGNMYRSVPTDWRFRQHITDILASQYDLTGMPGFFTKDNQWRMAGKRSGILIPVCDHHNLIQGVQIRLDEPPPKKVRLPDGSFAQKKGDRFRWLSTSGQYYQNGTGVNSYIHVVGDLISNTLYLTEGAMKADIASYLAGGALFAGLTGVQNVGYLADVIQQLHPRKIVDCIDMDKRTNPNVQRAQAKIQSISMSLCEEYRPFYWPPEQKGIDDYLLFLKLKQKYPNRAA